MKRLVPLLLTFSVLGAGVMAPMSVLAAEGPPEFLREWGSYGSGDSQFDRARSVATDSSGNVYVVDRDNERIQKFSSNGSFLLEWGEYGSGPGQFDNPEGVAVDASGNVFVTDGENERVQKFTSSGTYLTEWDASGSPPGQFDHPQGIEVDSSGNVYVTDREDDIVVKFTGSGVYVTHWGGWGSGDGQFQRPEGVAIDSSGNVYVADRDNHRVQKFTSSGTFIGAWGSQGYGNGEFERPTGVAVDSKGNVYVTDSDDSRPGGIIQKFSSSGAFLTQWGTPGGNPSEFDRPDDVTVSVDGTIYVADTRNNRVQAFGYPPEADFDADPRSGLARLQVSFLDQSRGDVTSWLWVFGDGTRSSAQNPTHVYAKGGMYAVSLTVTGPLGSDTLVRQSYIWVRGGDDKAPEPADLGVSYLNIDPAQVLPNQEVVVSANICNSGEESGSRTVSLMLNGEAIDSQSVSVSGGACQQVVFRTSRAVPGTYQVAIDGMTGQFSVLAPRTVTNEVPSQADTGLGTAGIIAVVVVMVVLIVALVVVFRRT